MPTFNWSDLLRTRHFIGFTLQQDIRLIPGIERAALNVNERESLLIDVV